MNADEKLSLVMSRTFFVGCVNLNNGILDPPFMCSYALGHRMGMRSELELEMGKREEGKEGGEKTGNSCSYCKYYRILTTLQ